MVIWSAPARRDLRAIYDYIAQGSRHYAKKVAQEIRAKADILEQLPRAGRKIPELDDEQVRELSVYSYRIIYEIRGGDVFVLAVIHKRRLLQAEEL